MCTLGEEGVLSLYPPIARRFPLMLAAADEFSGVSGRVFQMRLVDLREDELAF